MKLKSVKKSSKPDKKYMATFIQDNGREKTTHFGAKGMDDYTRTKDPSQKKRYRQRHAKDLHTNDPTRAGFLSYHLLWNKPTLRESIKDYKHKFHL